MKLVTCTNLDTVRIELLGEARALTIPAAAVLRMRDTQADLLDAARGYHTVLRALVETQQGHSADNAEELARVAAIIARAEGRAAEGGGK